MAIPISQFELQLPGMLVEGARRHNSLVRKALRAVLLYHHQVRIPKHFTRQAAQKYGHKPRNERYRRYKNRKFHSSTDLVKTGRTRHHMTTIVRPIMRGNAAGGTLEGRLEMRFPFPGGSLRFKKRTHQSVNLEQMALEIRTIAGDEQAEIARQLHDTYVHAVNTEAWTPQRLKIS